MRLLGDERNIEFHCFFRAGRGDSSNLEFLFVEKMISVI
jgi:hypothetical protein